MTENGRNITDRWLKKLIMMSMAITVATAFMTACTADDEALSGGAEGDAVAVAFDCYVPKTVTRSGDNATTRTATGFTGQIDRDALKRIDVGFGVFTHVDNVLWASRAVDAVVPNFMYNQQVRWDGSQWWYAPLKYWPNETGSGGSTTTDYLSFFAYAPYAAADMSTGATGATTGITRISTNTTTDSPVITYRVSADPQQGQDLLWGVKPGVTDPLAIGYDDTAGLPYTNLTKQHVDEQVGFLFRHALARMAIDVRTVVDELLPGTNQLDDNTRVEVKAISISGRFPTEGTLSLHNTTPNKALWTAPQPAPATPSTLVLDDFLVKLRNTNVNSTPRNIFTAMPTGTPELEDREYLMLIPTDYDSDDDGVTEPLDYTVSITYDIITRDSRIPVTGEVKTTTTQQSTVSLDLDDNKSYTLHLLLGVSSLNLTVSASAWGSDQIVEYTVDE